MQTDNMIARGSWVAAVLACGACVIGAGCTPIRTDHRDDAETGRSADAGDELDASSSDAADASTAGEAGAEGDDTIEREPDASTSSSDAGREPDADTPIDERLGEHTIPDDPGVAGPWPVGVRTAQLSLAGGVAPVEIWYPAERGSESGATKVVYDYIQWLPPEARAEVPAAEVPVNVACDCYRDLPIDRDLGPYPVAIYVHNIGAFRTASVGIMAHWASRGFVVLALDHPRLHLQDVLAYASLGRCSSSNLPEDRARSRDIPALLAQVGAPAGDFEFLSGAADASHVAVAGHSEGATFAVQASGQRGVRLIMQWNNSLEVTPEGDVEAVAFLTGSRDTSLAGAYSVVEDAAIDAPAPSLFVGIDDAGHLSMTELCNAKNSLGRDGMDIASRYELCRADYAILSAGWDCDVNYLDQAEANRVYGTATTAALEHYLKGIDHSAAWEQLRQLHGEVRVRTE